MRFSLAALWVGTVVLCAGMIGWSLSGFNASRTRSTTEQSAYINAATKIAQIESTPDLVRPDNAADRTTLATRVAGAVAQSGLPHAVLEGLSPESERVINTQSSVTVVRTGATLTLSPITLAQFGRFLATWRAEEPSWTAASIDITPNRRATTDRGGDLPLRVIVTIESIRVRGESP